MSTFSNENHMTRGFTSDAINEFAFRLYDHDHDDPSSVVEQELITLQNTGVHTWSSAGFVLLNICFRYYALWIIICLFVFLGHCLSSIFSFSLLFDIFQFYYLLLKLYICISVRITGAFPLFHVLSPTGKILR